jgi:hypothetical protein
MHLISFQKIFKHVAFLIYSKIQWLFYRIVCFKKKTRYNSNRKMKATRSKIINKKIEVISLKIYWDREKSNVTTSEQKQHNVWIDQVLSDADGLCNKAPYLAFSQYDKQQMIEFGEYLFLSLTDNNVDGFAVCVDYPSPSWSIWNEQKFSDPHGMVEISLLCSKLPGSGAKIIEEIKRFASSVLLRKQIELTVVKSIDNQSLLQYYEKLGFITMKNKSTQFHLRMKQVL